MDTRIIQPEELSGSLIAASMDDDDPVRFNNRALLHFACLLGLREVELSELTYEMFISEFGKFYLQLILPESITWDGYCRPLILQDPVVLTSFKEHIEQQLKLKVNTRDEATYLGLDPKAKVFFNADYQSFDVANRKGRRVPDKMNRYLDELIKKAGLWDQGVRRKSFLYTFISHAYRSGTSVNDIIRLTGLSEGTIARYLMRDYSAESRVMGAFSGKDFPRTKYFKSHLKRYYASCRK